MLTDAQRKALEVLVANGEGLPPGMWTEISAFYEKLTDSEREQRSKYEDATRPAEAVAF